MITPENKKNFIWNSLGAGLNAFHSPLFLMIVSRVLGIREAGFFTIAFTTGVLLSNIGLYNVRSYQITDYNRNHSDAVYLNARIVTSFFMILAVAAYSLTKISDPPLFCVVLLLGLWRVPEVMSDVIHGTLQMNRRLDLVGKSLLIRAGLCIAVFTVSVYAAHNLILACALLVCVNVLVFALYDRRNYRKICPLHKIYFDYLVRDLLRSCFPLFLISIIYSYLINAPRYAIDLFGTPEIQTVFSIIVLPASMIWVVFIMVLNPILPRLSELYFSGKRNEFDRRIRSLIIAIAVFCIIYLAFMYLAGIRVFEIVYKVPLLSYRKEFMLAGIASGFLCVATVYSNLLIMIRENKILLVSYILAAAVSAGSSMLLVKNQGLYGAAASYLISMLFLMMVLVAGYVLMDSQRKAELESLAGQDSNNHGS